MASSQHTEVITLGDKGTVMTVIWSLRSIDIQKLLYLLTQRLQTKAWAASAQAREGISVNLGWGCLEPEDLSMRGRVTVQLPSPFSSLASLSSCGNTLN